MLNPDKVHLPHLRVTIHTRYHCAIVLTLLLFCLQNTPCMNQCVSSDTKKRFDDFSNGLSFLTSKHTTVQFYDASNVFKPHCHTT